MMHEPDCPLFLHTLEGKGKKNTLLKVITDQVPRTRRQFENQKNALKISDDKVISAINQHLNKAQKKPEKPEKKKPENKQPEKKKPEKKKPEQKEP